MKTDKSTISINNISPATSCPHCDSTSIVRNGHIKEKQKYKCKNCLKNFIDTTGTPTHGLQLRNKIEKYAEALILGLSVRNAAKYAKMSNNTSFSWRHKFISSINNEAITKENNNPIAVNLIKTPYSNKGRQKSPEKIRKDSRTIIIANNNQLNIKKLDNKPINKQIAKILSTSKIMTAIKVKELTIITKKLPTNQVLKQNKIKTSLHNDIINQVDILNKWMARFRGVATKYLQQYWNWFCGLQNIKIFKNEKEVFLNLCLKSQTLQVYRQLREL